MILAKVEYLNEIHTFILETFGFTFEVKEKKDVNFMRLSFNFIICFLNERGFSLILSDLFAAN